MENKQPEKEAAPQDQSSTGAATGQQLPVSNHALNDSSVPAKDEHHSESSLPQKDKETLGTP